MGYDFEQVADELVAKRDGAGFYLAVSQRWLYGEHNVYVVNREVRPLVEWLKCTFPEQFVDVDAIAMSVSRESLEQYASTLRADLAAIERVLERFG